MEMGNPWLRVADHGLEYVLPFQGMGQVSLF
jgi:hypothetical protein